MDYQEIEVEIDKDGKVKLQVRGVEGSSCLELTRDLEAALGGEVIDREMKPEAYQGIGATEQDRLRQGQR